MKEIDIILSAEKSEHASKVGTRTDRSFNLIANFPQNHILQLNYELKIDRCRCVSEISLPIPTVNEAAETNI